MRIRNGVVVDTPASARDVDAERSIRIGVESLAGRGQLATGTGAELGGSSGGPSGFDRALETDTRHRRFRSHR